MQIILAIGHQGDRNIRATALIAAGWNISPQPIASIQDVCSARDKREDTIIIADVADVECLR